MKEDYKEQIKLSLNLVRLRTKRNLSQQKLCDQLKIKRSTYAGWEQGKFEPSIKMLCRLSKFYSVTIDALVL